jgi:hypothetical protein
MKPPVIDEADRMMVRAVSRRLVHEQFEEFTAQGRRCGWCSHPVRIRGVVMANDGNQRHVTFSTGNLPDGVLLKACGTRRETRCPSCAAVYRGDARHLVRAGLIGGKGIDESVTDRPAVLLTLTAPSFGVVHSAKSGGPCHPGSPTTRCPHGRPSSCFGRHTVADSVVGSPLCVDCYDYEGAVLHNACTPELWRRTTVYLMRHLAAVLGRSQAETKTLVKLSFCRVAEYQRRGVVHLHAVVRADGIDEAVPPLTGEQLARASLSAARAVAVPHPSGVARWGKQVDVQLLDRSDGQRAKKVAGYVAKYATKSSDETGALDHRITSEEDLSRRALTPHLRRMAEVAWALGAEERLAHLNLRRHAHSLGYGGHFLSKSRRYSTSFGALKADRAAWRSRQRHGVATADHSVEARWRAVGFGWASPGEALYAGFQQRQRAAEIRLANEDWYSRTA